MATKSFVIALFGVWMAVAGSIQAGPADESFATGNSLVAEGKLDEALKAYATAARADAANESYRQKFTLLRQVIELKRRLPVEKNAERWGQMAMSLYGFYAENGLLADALAIACQMHARQGDSDSAAMVAETALMMKKPNIAAETLSKLDAAKHSPVSRALLGIALAQQGKKDEAKRAAAALRILADDGPAALYAAARLQAVTGDSATALATLKTCFESVLPSRLDEFKQHAKECGEFASVAKSADFAAVLKTESKVAESKCSSGSSCAGCPMRGKCPPEEKP